MEQPKVIYSWTKGIFFLRIERNFYPDGQNEVIARIPRWYADSEWIAATCVRGLMWGEMFK